MQLLDTHVSNPHEKVRSQRPRGALCAVGEVPSGWEVTQETRKSGASEGVQDKVNACLPWLLVLRADHAFSYCPCQYFFNREGKKLR